MIRAGITLFLGQTLTGKTSLMLRELAHRAPCRALIFDPQRDEKLDAWPSIETGTEAAAFLGSGLSRGWWIRTVRGGFPLYEALARTVERWRGVLWIMDDSQALFSRRPIVDAAEAVAATGRHMGDRAGVELWVIAQRPMLVPATVRSQAQRCRSFFQNEPRDLAYLCGKFGRPYAEQVRSLRGHHFAAWPEGPAYERAVPRRGLVRRQGASSLRLIG